MKVIDNFLDESYFNYLTSAIMSDWFPWYYNFGILYPGDGQSMFTHTFFRPDDPPNHTRDYFYLLEHFVKLLDVKKLYRIKANLNHKTIFKTKTGYHYDFDDMTTSVFYMNTNNGGTKLKNGKFIKSVANRLVTFDSNLLHTGINCTDEQRRVVINFNYESTTF
tara:strand:+ start:24 stop:515 length:492 start_codon:yes stop_codon:yes gene_type:complete